MKNFIKILSTFSIPIMTLMPLTTFAANNNHNNTEENVSYQDSILKDNDKNETEVKVTQASTFSISIPKQIVLNGTKGEKNDADYIIVVKGNIASDEIVTVKPDDYFILTNTKNKENKLIATVSQDATKFVIENLKNKHFSNNNDYVKLGSTNGNVEVLGLTEGSWEGEFQFYINLTTTDF